MWKSQTNTNSKCANIADGGHNIHARDVAGRISTGKHGCAGIHPHVSSYDRGVNGTADNINKWHG